MEENHRAFLEATIPHLDAVYRVARYAGIGSWQPEDLVQETYLRAFAGFAGHTGASTRAWLITICLNVARSEGRRRVGEWSNRRSVSTRSFALQVQMSFPRSKLGSTATRCIRPCSDSQPINDSQSS